MYKEGDLINNRYKIEKLLGTTGTSRTYKARDQQDTKKIVLCKELLINPDDSSFTNQKKKELFLREKNALLELDHRQIPQIIISDNPNYLVENFCEGKTLDKKIEDENFIRKEKEVIRLLQKILKILEYVHSKEYIHRDIKPSNIILSETKEVYLIDFGSVVRTDSDIDDLAENKKVRIGYRTDIGTPGYAPREQFYGGSPCPSFDIYAVGIIGIEIITKKDPTSITIDNHKNWNKIWEKMDVPISDDLKKILEKMANDTATERYKSVQEVLDDLVAVLLNLFNNESQLLQGEYLQNLLDRIQDQKNLKNGEIDFLIKSIVWEAWDNDLSDLQKSNAAKTIKNNWSCLEAKASNSFALIREILEWTKPNPHLVQKICQVICDSNFFIPDGEEAICIEQLIEKHIDFESITSREIKELIDFKNKNIEANKNRILSHESNSSDLEDLDHRTEATPIQRALSRITFFIAIAFMLGITMKSIIDNFKVSKPSLANGNSSTSILTDQKCDLLSNKIVIAQATKTEQVNTIKEISLLIENQNNSLSTLCNEDIEKRFNKLLYDHAWILINGNNYVTNEKEEYDAIEALCLITENHQNFSDVTRYLQEWHSTDIEKNIPSDTRRKMRSKIKELYSQGSCSAAKLN